MTDQRTGDERAAAGHSSNQEERPLCKRRLGPVVVGGCAAGLLIGLAIAKTFAP